MTLWEKTEADAELAFELVVTLADQIAYNRHLHSLPSWRRHRANLVVASAISAPLVALVICSAVMLLFQRAGIDLDDSLGEGGRAALFATVLAALAAAEIVGAVSLYVWRRRLLEPSLRARLAARPSIDPADPALAERYAFAIHPMGFRASTDCGAHAVAWTVLQRFDETADHLFLMVEPRFGFIVPKRELAAPTVLALRRTKEEFDKAKPERGGTGG